MDKEIELGDKVMCVHTGFQGTAVCKSEFINGCVQWSVLPRLLSTSKSAKEGLMPEEVDIDSQSLKVVSKKKVAVEKQETGGPMRRGLKARGF